MNGVSREYRSNKVTTGCYEEFSFELAVIFTLKVFSLGPFYGLSFAP
jgi:hypothetical protein